MDERRGSVLHVRLSPAVPVIDEGHRLSHGGRSPRLRLTQVPAGVVEGRHQGINGRTLVDLVYHEVSLS